MLLGLIVLRLRLHELGQNHLPKQNAWVNTVSGSKAGEVARQALPHSRPHADWRRCLEPTPFKQMRPPVISLLDFPNLRLSYCPPPASLTSQASTFAEPTAARA